MSEMASNRRMVRSMLFALIGTATLAAQSPPIPVSTDLRFEVASVKPVVEGDRSPGADAPHRLFRSEPNCAFS